MWLSGQNCFSREPADIAAEKWKGLPIEGSPKAHCLVHLFRIKHDRQSRDGRILFLENEILRSVAQTSIEKVCEMLDKSEIFYDHLQV